MGYRSEVVLAISKDLMPHFLNVMAAEPDARTLVFKHHDTLQENYEGEGTLLVAWSDIKWYDSFPEVKAIQEFIEICEADLIEDIEDCYEHFRYVRLGEDTDDTTEKGELLCHDICITRSLLY
jgi:hypothetical protein